MPVNLTKLKKQFDKDLLLYGEAYVRFTKDGEWINLEVISPEIIMLKTIHRIKEEPDGRIRKEE